MLCDSSVPAAYGTRLVDRLYRHPIIDGGATYYQVIQQTNRHPERTPHRIDNRDQSITGWESEYPGNKLSQSSKDRNKREEDGG